MSAPLPNGDQIYDAIMSQIDSDLVSAKVNDSHKKLDKETDKQYAARMERYRKAFALYEKCFNTYISSLRAGNRKSVRLQRATAERRTKALDDAAEEKLLKQIATL